LSRPSTNGDVTAATVARPTEPQTTEPQSETEVTTQFIALSYVAPANLQDGGQIVRVELPRSAMASFGLPVNMDRFGERVKANLSFEAFNVFNTIHNTGIQTAAYSVLAGGIIRPVLTNGVSHVGDGSASQGFPDGTNARRMQAALRFVF